MATIIFYNLILFFSVFFVYLSELTHNRHVKRYLLFVAFLVIAAPAAFRYNIGYDYMSYSQIYLNNAEGYNIEFGFKILINFLNYFALPVQSFFIVTSIFIYGVLIYSLPKKFGYIVLFGFLTTFYFQSFTIIRSSFCYVILLAVTLNYINNNKKIFFIISIIITGVFIHKSAFIFLIVPCIEILMPLPILSKFKNIIIFLLVLFFPFGEILISIIIDSSVVELLGFEKYMTGSFFNQVKLSSGLGVLLKILCLFIPIYLLNNVKRYQSELYIIVIICILCVLSIIMAANIFIFSRLHYLFSLAYPLSLYLIMKIPNYYRKCSFLIVFIAYILFYEVDMLNNTTDKCESIRVSPYLSIFNKETDNSYPIEICSPKLMRYKIYD